MKEFKKYFAFLALSLMGAVSCQADGGSSLIVLLKDGSQEQYTLDQKPRLTFNGTSVVVESDVLQIPVPYLYSDIQYFYFDVVEKQKKPDIEDAIEKVEEEEACQNDFKFTYYNGTVLIEGMDETSSVKAYALNGTQVRPGIQRAPHQIQIELGALPTGIYIIKVGDRPFKVVKK